MTQAVGMAIALSATVTLLSFISHPGADKRGERLVLGAIFLLAIVTGACELFRGAIPGGTDLIPDASYADRAEEVAKDAFCKGIERLICEEYSLREESVQVSAEGFNLSTLSAERVSISLGGRGLTVDRAAVLRLLSDSGIKNCEVSYLYDTNA
jgi:hypothetical protein